MNRVSIIVNTYNRAQSLKVTLESLSYLDYADFEVIVVKGPCTDATDDLLAGWSGLIKIAHCPTRNLSESRNIGIAHAAGELVAFIDDDAYPDPAWLSELVTAFSSYEVAGAGGPVYDYTGANLQALYSLANRFGIARIMTEGQNPTLYLNRPGSQEFVYAIGTNAMFRRDLLVQIGGFDEEFDYYLDEADVCCRLVDRGYVIAAMDKGFVYHKALPSDVRNPHRAIRLRSSLTKNTCYFSLKHGLPSSSFLEVSKQLAAFVEASRVDYGWCVSNGLLTEDDFEQFERDLPGAADAGLQAYIRGPQRVRPPDWFNRPESAFLPFPTRRRAKEKLHLCFFSQEYPPGYVNGIGRVVHTLAKALAAQGHVVRVLTRGDGCNTVDLEDGVWVHRLVIRDHPVPQAVRVPEHIWNYSASLLDELNRIAEHRAVDIVEGSIWDSETVAVVLDGSFQTVIGLHTPLVVAREMMPPAQRTPIIDQMVSVEKFCCQNADAFRAAGSKVVGTVEKMHDIRIPRRRIGFIAHGLPDTTAGVEPRRRGGGVNVLFVGRLEKRKGVDTLLECIPSLLARFPSTVFTIAGNDSLAGDDDVSFRATFEAGPGKLLPQGAVEFTGIVDNGERQRLYAGCDIFVAPSRFESFGLILVEAMMFSKPVIGGDNDGMRQIIEEGGNGYLVPPGDRERLQAALSRLIESGDRRLAFGKRSRELFEQHFSVQRMATESNRFYDTVACRSTAIADRDARFR